MQKEVRLTDGVILLRAYRHDDADQLYDAARESLTELLPWMLWAHPDYSIDDSKTWIASCTEKWVKGTEYNFAITDARDGSFLGGCGLYQLNVAGDLDLGYWVRSTHTRRGIAVAAARLLASFAFNELKLKRIKVSVAITNLASQRVARKLGAKRVGVEKDKCIVRDRVYDEVVFLLTPKAPENRS